MLNSVINSDIYQTTIEYWPMFLEGTKNTLLISLIGTFFGVIIGVLLASLKTQKISERDKFSTRVVKRIGIVFSTIYVDVVRGTPMMLQAIILFNIFALKFSFYNLFASGIIIISLNTAAYATEVIRAGIQSIDKGQMEAARTLGMTESQAMIKVILPQAIKNVIPAIGNELVVNIKDTSVLSVIGVLDLTFKAKSIGMSTYNPLPPLYVAALIYLVLTMSLSRLLTYLDKRLNSPNNRNRKSSFPTSQSVPEVL